MANQTISETDLKNAAIALIGGDLLSSPTDDTKARRYADALFVFARNECFDLPVDWSFCTGRAQLSQHTDEPEFGSYDYQYVLPSGCRRVRKLMESTDDDTEYSFSRRISPAPTSTRSPRISLWTCSTRSHRAPSALPRS